VWAGRAVGMQKIWGAKDAAAPIAWTIRAA